MRQFCESNQLDLMLEVTKVLRRRVQGCSLVNSPLRGMTRLISKLEYMVRFTDNVPRAKPYMTKQSDRTANAMVFYTV